MTRKAIRCVLQILSVAIFLGSQYGILSAQSSADSPLWLSYSGEDGPGRGKHIVLIAAEQEYRSEQSDAHAGQDSQPTSRL